MVCFISLVSKTVIWESKGNCSHSVKCVVPNFSMTLNYRPCGNTLISMLSVFIGGFFGNLLSHFFSDYLSVPKLCYTFVAVNELATTYQRNNRMQRILKFFASFCADYLVNPNNLLTHTHTHTHTHTQARRILRFARTRA